MNDMELQRAEFDAADEFAKQLTRHNRTPVVDDDYPEVRSAYEGALHRFIRAMQANGRLAPPAPPVAAEAVQAEVVGKVRQRRGVHGDFDGFEVDWLLEGGIHAVGIDGETHLYVLDIPAPEDGHVELFAHPSADDKGAGSGEGYWRCRQALIAIERVGIDDRGERRYSGDNFARCVEIAKDALDRDTESHAKGQADAPEEASNG